MVQPGSPAIRLLENLPQRPPTPPRESDHSNIQAETSVLRRVFPNHLGAHTPPNHSPESTTGSSSRSADKSRKKVEWSAWTEYNDPPHKDSSLEHNFRPLPPSGELKPAKSILKPYNGANPIDRRSGVSKLAAPHTYPNFATMLESIVKQLAGEDRSSRIDAYLTLSGVLKASDNVPDPKALKEKMGLLTQFIQRDMSAKTASGILDTVIINNALILLAFFVWNPPAADCLSNEFCTYVVEHAISAIKDPLVSKDIVKHLLFILGRQNFSTRVMSAERVRRLIESLVDIETHVKGRSIILGRVTIYRKLLRQSRTSMLASLGWVENLFTDMISNAREIRAPAVAFGFEAALLLGTEKQASRAVMDLFRRDAGEIQYANYYAKRLGSMVVNKQDGDLVPQIWSIVVLFLRYRTHQLEHWEFITPWLHIIEKCFNSSDHDTKTQANLAWNRLVFAIQPEENTTPTIVKMLSKVLDLQLRRKLVGRNSKEARQVTIGSVRNLLYYALNPNAPFNQLDIYWDEYVVQLIGNTLVARDHENPEMEQADLAQAWEIMGALLDLSPKAWVNSRANENGVIKADELPGIDPKWIRKNAQRVFKVLGQLVQKCFRDLAKWQSSIDFVWSKFAASVAAAGAKEVKVSNDTMSSVACVFTLLYKLWNGAPKDLSSDDGGYSSLFQEVFTLLVTKITNSLGVLPFTEKLLAMGPQEGFAIVATPSHSPVKPRGEVRCPLQHLFVLLARPAAGISCDDSYLETVKRILQVFFEDRKTRRSCVELVKDLSLLLPLSSPDSRASLVLWRALASFTMMAFDMKTSSGVSSSSSSSLEQPLGSEYRNIIKILELGIILSPNEPLPDWRGLYTRTISQVTLEAGHSGRAISVIEPLSRALEERLSKTEQKPSLAYCTMLMSNALYPGEKQALDAAKRLLWGTSNIGSKRSSFDPYSHFYGYARQCLEESYKSLIGDDLETEIELLSSVSDLVQGCPAILITGLLTNIQSGLAPWISDEAAKYGGRKTSVLGNSVTTLWTNICAAISNLSVIDSGLLHSLENLISAGLESKHKRIVSATISLWNSTFGSETDLDYPARVTNAVVRLRSIADIRVPSFPRHLEDEVISTGPTFEDESQEENIQYDLDDYDVSRSSTSRERTPHVEPSPLPQVRRQASPMGLVEVLNSGSRKRPFQGTPENKRRKVAKKNLTPKLRHDDSQVQFAAIDSSPLANAVIDSQLLTERQREVKERQRETGAIFANLGVSPKFNPSPGTSDFLSATKQISPDDPSTPDLPLRDKGGFDGYITSSPTPRRGNLRVQLDINSIDPPSSPPDQSLREAIPKILVSDQLRSDRKRSDSDMWDVTSTPPVRSHDHPRSSTELGPSAQVVDQFMAAEVDLGTSLIEHSMDDDRIIHHPERPSTPSETPGALALEQQEARTPNEIFVDALSSPPPPTPAKEIISDEIRNNASSASMHKLVSQTNSLVTEDKWVMMSNSMKQHDSQISYSLSEVDEDSMLRLITKFDGPEPRHDHVETEASDDNEALESEPSQGDAYNSYAADSDQPEMVAALLSSTLGEQNVQRSPVIDAQTTRMLREDVKSSGQETQISKSLSPASPLVGSSIPSAVLKSQDKESLMNDDSFDCTKLKNIPREGKAQGHEKGTSKRTVSSGKTRGAVGSIARKRKIIDESAEIPSSLGADGIDSLTETTKPGLDRRDSISPSPTEEGQVFFTDPDVQTAIASDLPSDSEFCTPSRTHISLHSEPSLIRDHIQNNEKIRQEGSGAYKSRNGSIEICSGPGSRQEAEGSETNISHQYQITGLQVIGKFEQLLESLKSVALTRDEAQKVENLLWDVKGELYAAEKRGREAG